MIRHILLGLLVAGFLGIPNIYAIEHKNINTITDVLSHEHGSHAECPLPQTAADIVRCATEKHLAIQRIRLELLSADQLDDVARQIPNPELETKTVFGNSQGNKQIQSEHSIMQAIDLWGKRHAKVNEAKAQKRRIEMEVRHTQATVIFETVLNLHRLRQLDQELTILTNTQTAYRDIIRQMKTLHILNPEQEVALGVYEMALSDIQFKMTSLRDEERELEHYFHVNTRHGIDEIRPVVPPSPSSWPELDKNPNTSLSPKIEEYLADEAIAQARVDISQAEAWPDLKLGPVFVFNSQGSTDQQFYGGQLSLPLPLFQTNNGGRAYAKATLKQKEKATALLKVEEAHERAEVYKAYVASVKALQQAMPVPEIEKRFSTMERLRQRGLISSPLVVEAYRQRYEAYVNRNHREYMALNALWRLYIFDGNIFEVSL